MADKKAKPKRTFKERVKSFGEKSKKAYAAVNKGMNKLDDWYWGTSKKKTSTPRQRRNTKKV